MVRCLLLLLWGALSAACALKQKLPPDVLQPVPQSQAVVESYRLLRDRVLTIAAVGDLMLGGSAESYLETLGYDYPFIPTRHLLAAADITIGNLETALTRRGEMLIEKKYRFRNPGDKVAPALKSAGFDIVSLANNHTLDYGYEGLRDSFSALEQAGIAHHGAGLNLTEARRPALFTLENGLKVGFLAYSNTYPEEFWATASRPGTAFGHEQHVRADVSKLKKAVDTVVVSFHWGREGETDLQPYQIALAHAAIDSGADLVLGHHPHIVQAVEEYRGGLILYSLGNFVFGSFSNRVQYSVIANIHFNNGRYDRLEMIPVNVNNFQVYFQPQILAGRQAEAVFIDLQKQSLRRYTYLQRMGEVIVNGEPVLNK